MAVLLQGLFNFVYKVLTAMPIRSRTARSPLFPLALFGAVLMMPLGAAAETTSIRFQLDWRFEGPAAPFLMAAEKAISPKKVCRFRSIREAALQGR